MRYWFLIMLLGILYSCDSKQNEVSKNNDTPTEKNQLKIIDLDAQKKAEKLFFAYYEKWDEKLDKPIRRIASSDINSYNSYLKIFSNSKNLIVKIVRFSGEEKILVIDIEHDALGKIEKKVLTGPSTIIEEYYAVSGQLKKKQFFIPHLRKKYSLSKINYYNSNGEISKTEEFNTKGVIEYRSLYTYKDKKLVLKKIFTQNIFLQEYDTKLYLHDIEYYGKNGKLLKKMYYDQETQKLAHWNKFIYKKKTKIRYSYDPNNKLTEKSIYDLNDKLLNRKFYD